MMKNFILIYPMLLNLLMILMMMMPSKINKFHPITFLMILILLTFIICLKINFLSKSIMSFILFLIMIGGLMVIFMYITSLANNEFFMFNYKLILINLLKIFPIFLISILLTKNYIINLNMNEMLNMFSINNFENINIMYKELNNKSSYFIMLYLYYSMICIMKICFKLKAPLRQLLF